MRLNIRLGGAEITFAGEDVQQQAAEQTYDFTYTAGSSFKDRMIKASGDENAFTYSFAYHSDLPGYATFHIDTDFAPGKKVNIYEYDPDSQTYSLIAQNVTVSAGGIVSYINNTCSGYLITSKLIANAEKSESVSKQITAIAFSIKTK